MTRLRSLLYVLLFLLAAAAFVAASTQEPVPVVTEIQKLRAENLQLKIALAQANATIADRDAKIASLVLTQEQAALSKELLQQLKAKEGDELDWATLTLKPKKGPK